MRKSRALTKIRPAAALGCALAAAASLAGCSGGGGGTSPATATSNTPSSPSPSFTNPTGISGTVAAPAAATFGTAPAQTATAGGPTFDGKSVLTNITFPLISTSLQRSPSGLSAAAGDKSATITVVSSSSSSSTLQLTIPSLNVDTTIKLNTPVSIGLDQIVDGISYVAMGQWAHGNTGALQSLTAYAFGYETPAANMPASGTATFKGYGGGTVYKPVGSDIQSAYVAGEASFSVNFGSGQMTGSFTKMQVAPSQTWNDVSVTASIAAGTNRFNGTTAATSAPGTPMSLSGSATGNINGAFFGPAAQNLGAVWSLSDGTGSALGTFVAQ